MTTILFVLHYGGGNVIQTIPAYLQLVKARYEVDVVYLKQYPTESSSVTDLFPCDNIREVDPVELSKIMNNYDYVYKPPFLGQKGDYLKVSADKLRESDSEVRRNLKCIEHMGVEQEMLREWQEEKPDDFIDGEYITVHNGCVPDPVWEAKKYIMFPQLVTMIKQERPDLKVVCLGSKPEYIDGSIDRTTCNAKQTAYWIHNAVAHISTDTFTMHIAALVETLGIAIFTCTSWDIKNIDEEFHKTISVVHSDIPCAPCQKGYHWHPCREACMAARPVFPCQNIPPQKILDRCKQYFL